MFDVSTEAPIVDMGEIWSVLQRISLGHPLKLVDPIFWVEELPGEIGWLIQVGFVRPDRKSGDLGRGRSRRMFVAHGSTESATVKTVFALIDMTMRHELMEAFQYDGARIFDPHNSVGELSQFARIGATPSDISSLVSRAAGALGKLPGEQ